MSIEERADEAIAFSEKLIEFCKKEKIDAGSLMYAAATLLVEVAFQCNIQKQDLLDGVSSHWDLEIINNLDEYVDEENFELPSHVISSKTVH